MQGFGESLLNSRKTALPGSTRAVMILHMDEALPSKSRWHPPRLAVWLIVIGAVVATLSSAAIRLLSETPQPADAASRPPAILLPANFPTPTPPGSALIQRQAIAATAVPTAEPAAPTATFVPPPVIEWSDAEKNVLSWLCRGEVGGMAEVKVDACLSVISTVRARYAYGRGFAESDVMSTLERPGQFTGVVWYTDRPAPDPDLLWAVNQYQAGARGSCTGYLYFDSIPGGPVLCTIVSSNGQFLDFHNGWR